MATVLTSAGEGFIVDLLDGTVTVPIWYVAWGKGTTAASKADTALNNASQEARVTAALSQPAVDTNQFVGTVTAASAQSITEAGVLTSSTGGVLLIHGDFTAVAVAVNDRIEFTVTLQQT